MRFKCLSLYLFALWSLIPEAESTSIVGLAGLSAIAGYGGYKAGRKVWKCFHKPKVASISPDGVPLDARGRPIPSVVLPGDNDLYHKQSAVTTKKDFGSKDPTPYFSVAIGQHNVSNNVRPNLPYYKQSAVTTKKDFGSKDTNPYFSVALGQHNVSNNVLPNLPYYKQSAVTTKKDFGSKDPTPYFSVAIGQHNVSNNVRPNHRESVSIPEKDDLQIAVKNPGGSPSMVTPKNGRLSRLDHMSTLHKDLMKNSEGSTNVVTPQTRKLSHLNQSDLQIAVKNPDGSPSMVTPKNGRLSRLDHMSTLHKDLVKNSEGSTNVVTPQARKLSHLNQSDLQIAVKNPGGSPSMTPKNGRLSRLDHMTVFQKNSEGHLNSDRPRPYDYSQGSQDVPIKNSDGSTRTVTLGGVPPTPLNHLSVIMKDSKGNLRHYNLPLQIVKTPQGTPNIGVLTHKMPDGILQSWIKNVDGVITKGNGTLPGPNDKPPRMIEVESTDGMKIMLRPQQLPLPPINHMSVVQEDREGHLHFLIQRLEIVKPLNGGPSDGLPTTELPPGIIQTWTKNVEGVITKGYGTLRDKSLFPKEEEETQDDETDDYLSVVPVIHDKEKEPLVTVMEDDKIITKLPLKDLPLPRLNQMSVIVEDSQGQLQCHYLPLDVVKLPHSGQPVGTPKAMPPGILKSWIKNLEGVGIMRGDFPKGMNASGLIRQRKHGKEKRKVHFDPIVKVREYIE